MTEAEWLACNSFVDILRFFPASTSPRKLRLFAVACCRRLPGLAKVSTQVLDVAERFAEGLAELDTLRGAYMAAYGLVTNHENNPEDERAYDAVQAVAWAAVFGGVGPREIAASAAHHAGRAAPALAERRAQAHLLTDIMLVPPSAAVSPAWIGWNDGLIPRLAQAIYEDRQLPAGSLDTGRLAILADALLDAGCDDEDLIRHCRSDGPHVRGCWAVDLLLGKE